MSMHRYDEALSVAESVENPGLRLTTQGLPQLRFYKHRDLAMLERDVAEILNGDVPEGRRDDVLFALFEVQLASQDITAAQETLNLVSDVGLPSERSVTYLPLNHSAHLWLYLVTGDLNGATEELKQIRLPDPRDDKDSGGSR